MFSRQVTWIVTVSSENRTGRNEPCTCGSGRKFKHCHGGPVYFNTITRGAEAAQIARQLAMAAEKEQQRTQGLGRPIQSAATQEARKVFVGHRSFSGTWKTFADFLMFYITQQFENEWGNGELAKAPKDRHPLLNLYQKVCAMQKQACVVEGEVFASPVTGAVSAYLGLAYDLYCIEHNARTQPIWDRLMHRLRTPDHFYATCYEVMAAAAFARAGFVVDFEDDTDLDADHVEFVTTHPGTGKQFAVECKCRKGDGSETSPSRTSKQLARALRKQTDLDRVVFIELDLRVQFENKGMTPWLRDAIRQLEALEANPQNGGHLPPAYVFLTNRPQFHLQDDHGSGFMGYLHGFKIPDLRYRETGPLEDLVNARENHPEIHELLRSLNMHSSIPDSFDGSNSPRGEPKKTPLDYYDFVQASCAGWSKAQLLQFMQEWPNIAELQSLPRDELAKQYSIRWAGNFMAHHAKSA